MVFLRMSIQSGCDATFKHEKNPDVSLAYLKLPKRVGRQTQVTLYSTTYVMKNGVLMIRCESLYPEGRTDRWRRFIRSPTSFLLIGR